MAAIPVNTDFDMSAPSSATPAIGASRILKVLPVGRVAFSNSAGDLASTSAFTWDDTNKRLGVNITGTAAFFSKSNNVSDVAGCFQSATSATSTSTNTEWRNAAGTVKASVRDDGTFISLSLTASRALVSGAASEINSSAVTATELGYLSGVTSAIQTQLNALAATLPVADTQTLVKGSADATKLLRFEVDGFTTATTRVLTPPNADIVIAGSASALTSGRIPYATTGGLLTDSANAMLDSSGNLFVVKGIFGSASLTTAQVNVTPGSAATKGLLIKGAASQSENLLEFQRSTGLLLGFIGYDGQASFRAGFSSYTADGVWNASALTSGILTPVSSSYFGIIFGYADGGAGQYQPSIGFNATSTNYSATLLTLQNRVNAGTPESYNRWQVSHGGQISWGSGSAAVDIGIGRNAAGVLEINNGTAGTYRDLLLRNLTVNDGGNIAVGTTTGTKIGTATNQKLSVWNATPIVQPSSTGQTAGFTANASTPVLADSTFTGGTGATAYTIGDIIKHLKAFGLLAP